MLQRNVQKKKSYKCVIFILTLFLSMQLFIAPALAASATGPTSTIDSGEIYYIKNKHSGRYLTVEGSTSTVSNGDRVIQARHKTDAVGKLRQQWKVEHLGGGEYRLISLASPANDSKSLDVSSLSNSSNVQLDVYSDANTTDRRWNILLNSDGCSHRIMSKCSNYTKGASVLSGSRYSDSGSIVQSSYSENLAVCEWLFEPALKIAFNVGSIYAKRNYNTFYPTYPNCRSLGGDCANFVSQCLVAEGVRYCDEWWVYPLNGSNPEPTSASNLDASWDLDTIGGFLGIGGSSPWISAAKFCDFWSSRVSYVDYTGEFITQNPVYIFNLNIYAGDAITILNGDSAQHTLYISGYAFLDSGKTFLTSAHSVPRYNRSLLEIAAERPTSTFRFYKFVNSY